MLSQLQNAASDEIFSFKKEKKNLNCGTNRQESLAKVGKYYQEAIKIPMGLLKAID